MEVVIKLESGHEYDAEVQDKEELEAMQKAIEMKGEGTHSQYMSMIEEKFSEIEHNEDGEYRVIDDIIEIREAK